jgi:hypothetical protein
MNDYSPSTCMKHNLKQLGLGESRLHCIIMCFLNYVSWTLHCILLICMFPEPHIAYILMCVFLEFHTAYIMICVLPCRNMSVCFLNLRLPVCWYTYVFFRTECMTISQHKDK